MAKKLVAVLSTAPDGAVLADECQGTGVVRLWTLIGPFKDGRTLRALRRFFPSLEVGEKMIRLGGWRSLAETSRPLAEAKMTSLSPAIQGLFRWDTPESLATLKHFS